jgi:acyl-CoA synthetase (AMP-forming)/AMP-acid ligase II
MEMESSALHVFMGYLREERKTRETIDEDRWLHSGDIGKLDKDGEKRERGCTNMYHNILLELNCM